jgi:hypothetical protein
MLYRLTFGLILFSLFSCFCGFILGVHLKLCCLIPGANKVDSQTDRGGIIGILFMALALAIVSFQHWANSRLPYWLKLLLKVHPSSGCSVFHWH